MGPASGRFAQAFGPFAALLLAGCGSNPQLLTFNYLPVGFPDVVARDSTARAFVDGRTRLADISPYVCNFTADFSASPAPVVTYSFRGQSSYGSYPGFQARIEAPTPMGIPVENPPNCPDLSQFTIRIGSADREMILGRPVRGSGTFRLTGRPLYQITMNDEAVVSDLEMGNTIARTTGRFRLAIRLDGDPNQLLLIDGSYNLKSTD